MEKCQGLFRDCRYSNKRTRDKAQLAVDLLEKDNKHTPLYVRGLVSYPDLLYRYLSFAKIDKDDFCSAVCRCIEKGHRDSLEILANLPFRPSLLLLPKIDEQLYIRAKELGFFDPYRDDPTKKYIEPSLCDLERESRYVGYRQAFHLLMYGKDRKIELLDWWKRSCTLDDDCTVDAAREFFSIETAPRPRLEMLIKD